MQYTARFPNIERKQLFLFFLTRELITKNLRLAATTKHGVTKKEHLQRFSPHSVRVGACILLNTVGKNSDFIKKRLRWRSDTYQDYLRNLPELALQHASAIASALSSLFSKV